MPSPSAPEKSPILNFLAFAIAFGWEGPVILSIGLRNESTLEIMIGLVFTIFFWSLFGFKLLRELVRHVFRLGPVTLTDKPAAKKDQQT